MKKAYDILLNIRVFLLAALLGSTSVWAQQPRGDYIGSPMMWHGGWYGMFFGPIMMIIFIGVAVLLVRWFGGSTHVAGPPRSPEKDPLDILKERFARGEIDKDEYEERRRILRG